MLNYRALDAYYAPDGASHTDCGLLARRLKTEGDNGALVDEAARRLLPFLPRGCVVIPMPSHLGEPTYMGAVADRIRELRPDLVVSRCLGCRPHEGMYKSRKEERDVAAEDLRMKARWWPCSKTPVVIDNVIASGATARAAEDALRKIGAEPPFLFLADDVTKEKLRY